MLQRASFQNFKVLKDVSVDLTPFTVLVGKNGSGKTSVLAGIHDVSRVPVTIRGEKAPAERLSRLFSRAHDPRRLVTQPGRGPMSITLTDTGNDTLSVEARLEPDGNDGESVAFAVGVSGNKPPRITLPGDDHQAREFLGSRAAQRFGSAVFLRLDASVMVRESIPSSEDPRLEYDGEGLASVLSYMAGAAPEALESIRSDLASIVPQVRGIRTYPARVRRRERERITIDGQVVHRSIDEMVMGHRFSLDMGSGHLVPADLLSEGTVLGLGLLTALRHPQCPRLVLMDDVDGALHSAAQAELVRCLRKILESRPEVQIVCTSHSPDLLDHVLLEEVRVMALDKYGYARCGRLSDHPDSAQWRKMLRTGEFWASVGEDWLVEGPAEGP